METIAISKLKATCLAAPESVRKTGETARVLGLTPVSVDERLGGVRGLRAPRNT